MPPRAAAALQMRAALLLHLSRARRLRLLALALALALALLSACGTATLVALALPALMRRINVDPAFGAGPLATVIQDLCSIAIYLAVVIAVAA